jgi:hypothetical protein
MFLKNKNGMFKNRRMECFKTEERNVIKAKEKKIIYLAFSQTDHTSVTKKMETQNDLKQERRSFTKEFKLKVVTYYHDNMKNNNKTATHFNLDRKQVIEFPSLLFWYKVHEVFCI